MWLGAGVGFTTPFAPTTKGHIPSRVSIFLYVEYLFCGSTHLPLDLQIEPDTLYGNSVAVRRLGHKDALEDTISEGLRIVKDELEHYLGGRDRAGHLAALKAAATAARWSEIKGAVEVGRGSTVNDTSIYNILESLKATMLIDEADGKWIGLKEGDVVAVSETHEDLYRELKKRGVDGVYVFYSPTEKEKKYGFLF